MRENREVHVGCLEKPIDFSLSYRENLQSVFEQVSRNARERIQQVTFFLAWCRLANGLQGTRPSRNCCGTCSTSKKTPRLTMLQYFIRGYTHPKAPGCGLVRLQEASASAPSNSNKPLSVRQERTGGPRAITKYLLHVSSTC